MSPGGRSLTVDADGPSPREEGVGDFTELPMALLFIGQPDPFVVPLLHRPHVADMLAGAHLGREVLAHEGRGLRNPHRLRRACRGRTGRGPGVTDQCHGQRDQRRCKPSPFLSSFGCMGGYLLAGRIEYRVLVRFNPQ